MRSLFALAALVGAAGLAAAQEAKPKPPEEVPPRFGVAYRAKTYPQATPKQALESAIAAADRTEFPYLVAHLLDPEFVDKRIGDRSKQVEPAVADELGRLREFQQQNLDRFPPDARVPVDAAKFRARVAADAQAAAFRQFVRDVQEKLTDDPEVLKDLRRFNREGTFPPAGGMDPTAKVGLTDVRDRAVYLKRVGDRWYVENRQTDEKAPDPKEPKKEPDPKKD